MISISVIVGSTREGRFAEKPAQWVLRHLQQRSDVTAALLDLRDYPMPYFNERMSPAYVNHPPYTDPAVLRWTEAIGAADAFVMVTPEYNHGYPAVLKNAIDYVFPEWNRKPVAFVSYGNVGGARAIEQLREVAVELEMAPIRSAIHVPIQIIRDFHLGGEQNPTFSEIDGNASAMIDDLLWWAKALKTARDQ